MSDIVILLLFGIVVLVGAALIVERRRTLCLANFDSLQERFFEAAQKLAEDERTPVPVLDMIAGMAHTIRMAQIVRHAVWTILSGKARALHDQPPQNLKEFRESAQKMPKELIGLLAEATVWFVFAVSFRSVSYGWLLRRLLFQLNENQGRTANSHTIDDASPVLSEVQLCAA